MTFSTTRLTAIAAAALLTVSLSVPAFAQQATVGPAGGVPSTTAQSNSEGTPAGGTGVLGTTRVGPSTVTPMANPNTAPMATPATTRGTRTYHRRHRHHRHHRAVQTGTQSQSN